MNNEVRPSVIAGTWYPGDREQLRKTINGYFNKVDYPIIDGEIVGLISPHAGYVYSGQVAAYGYKQLMGKSFDVVIIISPLHQIAAGRYIVNSADYYSTPLGNIAIDKKLLEKIGEEIDLTTIRVDNEHSLEIQLPFLQVALGDFSLLPLMVGYTDLYDCEDMVEALSRNLEGKNVLLIASTDLHHIPDYDEVRRKDKQVVRALSDFNIETIREVLDPVECSVCGRVPISIVVDACQRLGANRLEILHSTNSGDVTGDKAPGRYTVGYLSAAIIRQT